MARGRTTPIKIVLTDEEKAKLEATLKDNTLPDNIIKRIQSVLMLADGEYILHISNKLNLTRKMIRMWGRRYLKQGFDSLFRDAPRSGRPQSFSAEAHRLLLKMASEPPEKYGRKKWSNKALKEELIKQGIVKNISAEIVRRKLKE